ncbi:hypothetical protein ABT352_06605 [Streptosporangium sp. NPDC000563]|uniref:hypothetical protein n=1 Tax=Streptosporangium sp. NPDC000563 TaxID=3154366 RepID=UPI00331AFCC7
MARVAVGRGRRPRRTPGRRTAEGRVRRCGAPPLDLQTAKDRDRALADALGEIVKKGLKLKDGDGDDPPFIEAKIN